MRQALRSIARPRQCHFAKALRLCAELNVIGRTTDEAVDETDKFLDQAFLNGLEHVRIIHGHGTCALRRAISSLLKDHSHVERFSPAPQNQGGSGATLVELKQSGDRLMCRNYLLEQKVIGPMRC